MTVGSNVKQTLSTLKSCEANLRIYSLQEQNKNARDVYNKAFKDICEIKADLEKRVAEIEFQEPQYKGN